MTSSIDSERIRAVAGCPRLRVRSVEEIGSTNEALMEASFEEAPAQPILLAAVAQTAARGRRGREWISERGRSLAFSVAFERLVGLEPPPSALPIAVGAATASALAPWAPDIRLKWPNDLQRAGRKLGGILVETRRGLPLRTSPQRSIERIVVGIGINLTTPRANDRIEQPACGLFDGAASPDDVETVIGCVAGAVVPAFDRFLVHGLAPFLDTWRRFDALVGEAVAAMDGDRVLVSGRALGIDSSGGLRVQTASGLHVFNGGEVSLRRSASVR